MRFLRYGFAAIVATIGLMHQPVAASAASSVNGAIDIDSYNGAIELKSEDRPAKRTVPAKQPADFSGNPLWSIPLSALSATRERPLFSPTRRPSVPPAVAVAAVAPRQQQPPQPAEPEPLHLVLVGTIVSESGSVGIFTEGANAATFRMQEGETRKGWRVSSIANREVTLTKGDRTTVVPLVKTGPLISSMPQASMAPPAPAPADAAPSIPYAPFVPRSTLKNGESDGL